MIHLKTFYVFYSQNGSQKIWIIPMQRSVSIHGIIQLLLAHALQTEPNIANVVSYE